MKAVKSRYYRLGAVHDGSPPPSYLGGPGAEKCRWEDGYIMSDLRHTEKGFKWSHCSVSSFHHFLKYASSIPSNKSVEGVPDRNRRTLPTCLGGQFEQKMLELPFNFWR